MSTNLYWRPTKQGERIGFALKYALAPRIWQQDGSLYAEWTPVGRSLIPFLEGVAAASERKNDGAADEARALIELIERHGEVEVALR